MDTIEVGAASDDRYAPYLGVMLHSLAINNPQEQFRIFIIDGGISQENRQKIDEMFVNKPLIHLQWLTCSTEAYQILKVDGHISRSAYFRLSLPSLVPETVEKLLYLDSDLLILGPVRPLWDTPLQGNVLAAVKYIEEEGSIKYFGLVPADQSFNSGVMLMDLVLWRKERITEKVIDFIRDNSSKIRFWDQDGLNMVLHHRWQALNENWNKLSFFLQDPHQGFIPVPHIIHFASACKPWSRGNRDTFRFLYFKYLGQTSWKGTILKDNRFDHIILRWCFENLSLKVIFFIISIRRMLGQR